VFWDIISKDFCVLGYNARRLVWYTARRLLCSGLWSQKTSVFYVLLPEDFCVVIWCQKTSVFCFMMPEDFSVLGYDARRLLCSGLWCQKTSVFYILSCRATVRWQLTEWEEHVATVHQHHHFSTLKIKSVCCSETSVGFQRNTELFITAAVRTSHPT
jgi:hypothetical protein